MTSIASASNSVQSSTNANSIVHSHSSKLSTSASIGYPPATVNTPAGTISITLAAPPTVAPPFHYESLIVPMATIIGVGLTIWFGFRKTTIELGAAATQANLERDYSRDESNKNRSHDADQAHQARITSARREVYLELVSGVVKSQMLVGRVATLDIEKLDIAAELEGLIIATSKISILGEMGTVEKSRELLTRINEALYKSLAFSIPLRESRDLVRTIGDQLSHHQLTIAELEREMQELFVKRDMGIKSIECNRNLEFHRSEVVRCSEQMNSGQSKLADEYEKFTQHMLEMAHSINRKVNELVILIRSELHLHTSEDELNASSDAMQAAAEKVMKQFFVDLNSPSINATDANKEIRKL